AGFDYDVYHGSLLDVEYGTLPCLLTKDVFYENIVAHVPKPYAALVAFYYCPIFAVLNARLIQEDSAGFDYDVYHGSLLDVEYGTLPCLLTKDVFYENIVAHVPK